MQHSRGFLALVADANTRVRECAIEQLAADALQKMGHNVTSMQGGFRAWAAAGYPVARGAVRR